MKLLVKVIEAKYSDSPQMAVVEMTPDFLETVHKLAGKGSVSFTGEDLGEFLFIDQHDLTSLLKATNGRASGTSSHIWFSKMSSGPATGRRSRSIIGT